MKKILCILSMLVFASSCFAAEIDRKIVKDTTVEETAEIVLEVIKQYEGVITVKEIDKEKYTYVVDYNKHTTLSYIGISNDKWANVTLVSYKFQFQGPEYIYEQ